ncbi:MAG TPA: isoprenylcysteine carboxylmethyltransferase family protein [Vicinamibacterales bacterium]|nr:isoprenylcysteine carboxylmethyltransferase family protein [Vicinamibacterales bacterium]
MTPLPYAYPYAIVFWAIFAWAYWPEFHVIRKAGRPATRRGSPDAGSLHVIMFGTWAAYILAVPLGTVRAFRFPASLALSAFVVGLALLVAGSLLRRHCFRMLGESFTGDVRTRPDQRIVTDGAYRILRHPAYTAGIVMHTAFGIALGSWGSALVLAVAAFATYRYRIAVEERALAATLGEPYRQFMQGRKRLIPYIY